MCYGLRLDLVCLSSGFNFSWVTAAAAALLPKVIYFAPTTSALSVRLSSSQKIPSDFSRSPNPSLKCPWQDTHSPRIEPETPGMPDDEVTPLLRASEAYPGGESWNCVASEGQQRFVFFCLLYLTQGWKAAVVPFDAMTCDRVLNLEPRMFLLASVV